MGSITPQKPLILIIATPWTGHMIPMRGLAAGLVSHGYEVTYIAPTFRRAWVESAGATWAPIDPYLDLDDAQFEKRWDVYRRDHAPGLEKTLADLEHVILDIIPAQHESLQKTLRILKEKDPLRPIVLLNEGVSYGSLAFRLGAPGIKPDVTMSIGVVPVMLLSEDCPFFGSGLPVDSSPEGKKRNTAMNKHMMEDVFAASQELYQKKFTDLGAKRPSHSLFDHPFYLSERFIQLNLEDLEYPRSDAPNTLRYAGPLPAPKATGWVDAPAWWSEITENVENKKIVFVCQGTVQMDYSQLVIPTLNALRDRDDLIVVAALARDTGKLPDEFVVPSNSRVAGYVPFQDILSMSDVFVTNGGYGGFTQSVVAGVPMVIAGITEDKVEVSARCEWSGCGVNLKTQTPTPEAVGDAVTKILGDKKYENRLKELKDKAAASDAVGFVIEEFEGLLSQRAAE